MESGADRKIKKKLLLKSFKKGYKKITTSKKYKEKVKILKESYFNGKSPEAESLTEETTTSSKPLINEDMNVYVNSISKHLKAIKG
jgi:hypothetical protein